MDAEFYKKLIGDHKELSSLPQTLSEVIRITRDETSSANDLAEVIMKDPALTTKVLRVVNSPFFGVRKEITTLTQAVVTLGMRAVSALALSTSIYDMTGKWELSIDRVRFWRHSLQVAIGARIIAMKAGYPHPEEAFIVGLIHDIGILVLEKSFPDKYARVWKQNQAGEKLHELEEQIWGTNHARIGQFLLEQWHLPSVLAEAVGHHHLPILLEEHDPEFRLSQIVVLANVLAQFKVSNLPAEVQCDPESRATLSDILDLTDDDIKEIEKEMMSRTVNEAEFLGIEIGSDHDLLVEANQLVYQHYLAVENLLLERSEMQKEINRAKMEKAALETLKTISATFNHYINNAAATILGRAQLLELKLESGEIIDNSSTAKQAMKTIINGVQTISAVLSELKKLSEFNTIVYHDDTYIIDIEKKIKAQLASLEEKPAEVAG